MKIIYKKLKTDALEISGFRLHISKIVMKNEKVSPRGKHIKINGLLKHLTHVSLPYYLKTKYTSFKILKFNMFT